MKLLVILLATLVYKNWSGGNPVTSRLSLSFWFNWLNKQKLPGSQLPWVPLLVYLGIPLALMVLIAAIFSDWLVVLVYHLLALLLLVYSLGDWEKLHLAFEQPVDEDQGKNLEAVFEEAVRSKEEVIYRMFEILFATVAWYLILGPIGLLIYVLLKEYGQAQSDDQDRGLSQQIIYYAEWIPSRMTCLLFSVTGNFVDTFADWMESLFRWTEPVTQTLVESVNCALSVKPPNPEDGENLTADIEMEMEEVSLLLDRTVWAWVGVAALVTIMGF